MTPKQAIEILRKHNAWRRYDGPVGQGPNMQNPVALGEAIDTVCDALEKFDGLEKIENPSPADWWMKNDGKEYCTGYISRDELPWPAEVYFKAKPTNRG